MNKLIKQNHRTSRGFSLIEILIVVGIISLLTTILITGATIWTEKAKISQTEHKLVFLDAIVGTYHAKLDRYFNGNIRSIGVLFNRLSRVDDTASLIGGILTPDNTIPWSSGNGYTQAGNTNPGSIVFYENRTYQCITSHTAATINEPGKGTNWETYWNYEPVLDAWDNPIRLFNPNPNSPSDKDPAAPYFWSYGPDGVNGTGIPNDIAYTNADYPAHWKDFTAYTAGDYVLWNGKFYRCILAHTASASSASAPRDIQNTMYWEMSDDIGTFK